VQWLQLQLTITTHLLPLYSIHTFATTANNRNYLSIQSQQLVQVFSRFTSHQVTQQLHGAPQQTQQFTFTITPTDIKTTRVSVAFSNKGWIIIIGYSSQFGQDNHIAVQAVPQNFGKCSKIWCMQRMNGNQQHHTYGMYECNVLNTITLNTAYELTTAYTTVTLNKKWIFNVMIVKIIHLI